MKLDLPHHEVHIWFADLSRAIANLSQFKAYLSIDEQERAKRYTYEQHRQRFIAARGILRILLSRYLGITPDDVAFAYESHGKPILDSSFASYPLHFNSSHSQAFALYAFICDRPVGIDLEAVHPIPKLNQLAQRFFTEQESSTLQNLPMAQQQRCFFRYWTCKEAYLKATGVGLTELKNVEIKLDSHQPAQFSKVGNNCQTAKQWQLHELRLPENYVGAIAWEGPDLIQKYQEFV